MGPCQDTAVHAVDLSPIKENPTLLICLSTPLYLLQRKHLIAMWVFCFIQNWNFRASHKPGQILLGVNLVFFAWMHGLFWPNQFSQTDSQPNWSYLGDLSWYCWFVWLRQFCTSSVSNYALCVSLLWSQDRAEVYQQALRTDHITPHKVKTWLLMLAV